MAQGESGSRGGGGQATDGGGKHSLEQKRGKDESAWSGRLAALILGAHLLLSLLLRAAAALCALPVAPVRSVPPAAPVSMARRRPLAVTLLPVLLLLLLLIVSQPAWASSSANEPSQPSRFSSPSAALCSELDSCARCLTNSSCAYCAYEGQQQGDGLCLERGEGAGTATQCSEPEGTLIKTADQCAAAADDTCESRSSCDTCATAPLALHCGWSVHIPVRLALNATLGV